MALLSFLFAGISSAADVQVLHVEPISVDVIDAAGNSASLALGRKSQLAINSAQRRHLQFGAFGRNFAIELESHSELDRIAATAGSRARSFRGSLQGNSASWVRLTQTASGLHGIVWDGRELYAVEPASDVHEAARLSGTVIFRLGDTITDLGANACATFSNDASADTTGSTLYNNLQGELKTAMAVSPTSAPLQLQLSAVMDAAFRQQYASDSDAADAIIARINNIDGIFKAQVGVSIVLKYLAPSAATDSQLSATTSAGDLLSSLSRYRSSNVNLSSTGVTHLFTGRDLDGNTVGISYIDAVCNTTFADTLSESRGRGAWFDSLIAAHELGHSFGAPHDGEGSCTATGNTFLMAAMINGSDQFSQCSRDIISRRVSSASCLVPTPVGDISVTPDLGGARAALEQTFAWSVIVANSGGAAVSSAQLQINVPASLRVSTMRADQGTCSQGAGVVVCQFDAIEASGTRNVELQLQSSIAGTYQITATASASADANTNNDAGSASIVIETPAQSNAGAAPTTSPTAATSVPIPSASGSGGGGGAMSNVVIAFLLGMLALLNAKRLRVIR